MRRERIGLGGHTRSQSHCGERCPRHEAHPGPAARIGEEFLQRRDAGRAGRADVAAQRQGERNQAVFTVQRVELRVVLQVIGGLDVCRVTFQHVQIRRLCLGLVAQPCLGARDIHPSRRIGGVARRKFAGVT